MQNMIRELKLLCILNIAGHGLSVIWVGYRISNQPIGDRFQNRLRRNEIWHNFIK